MTRIDRDLLIHMAELPLIAAFTWLLSYTDAPAWAYVLLGYIGTRSGLLTLFLALRPAQEQEP